MKASYCHYVELLKLFIHFCIQIDVEGLEKAKKIKKISEGVVRAWNDLYCQLTHIISQLT